MLAVFGARRHRVGQCSQGFRPWTCCRRAPPTIANPCTHLATTFPRLVRAAPSACWGKPSFDNVFPTHIHHPCSPVSGTFVVGPIGVHPVGSVSSMADSVAAICWSLENDFETSVIVVGAGGGVVSYDIRQRRGCMSINYIAQKVTELVCIFKI